MKNLKVEECGHVITMCDAFLLHSHFGKDEEFVAITCPVCGTFCVNFPKLTDEQLTPRG